MPVARSPRLPFLLHAGLSLGPTGSYTSRHTCRRLRHGRLCHAVLSARTKSHHVISSSGPWHRRYTSLQDRDTKERRGRRPLNPPESTSRSSSDSPFDAIDSEHDAHAIQILDLDYVLRTQPLPSKENYPNAPTELLQPHLASVAINAACQHRKLSMDAKFDFTTRTASKRLPSGQTDVKICFLSLSVGDFPHVEATGEGLSKQSARQAAWLMVLSKLHIGGTLRELLPSFGSESQENRPMEPIANKSTAMPYESDAKVDIYNYAASLGMVPTLKMEKLSSGSSAISLARKATHNKALFQLTVELPGLGISATSAGDDRRTTENAACIAFKQQAETRKIATTDHRSSVPETTFSILSTDTARAFLDFYQARRGVSFEVEIELLEEDVTQHMAHVIIDGKRIGDAVIMPSKRQAQTVAHLVAAVEVAAASPDLLDEFTKSSRGSGRDPRPLEAVDLDVSYKTLSNMQQALAEAKMSGLSDERRALKAVSSTSDNGSIRNLRQLSRKELASANARLLSHQKKVAGRAECADLQWRRAALPVNHYREQLLEMIGANTYSIVVGATGSGKTTQIPQILFENAVRAGRGSSCNILCTQPRRIAATSVAQRVATERGEELKDSVGYHVRFDARPPRHPYGILYCTTRILLERLKHGADALFDSTSHIVIDEVHERDLDLDYLLIVLKRGIQRRQLAGRSVPRVVLMSATLDVDRFAAYFQQEDVHGHRKHCPTITIPGRGYPVIEQYLGSILDDMFKTRATDLQALLREDKKSEDFLKAETDFSASQSQARPGTKISRDVVIDWKRKHRAASGEDENVSYQQDAHEALVPTCLVAATIAHICCISTNGAVLVFLPGIEDILAVQKVLTERQPFSVNFSDTSKYRICLLHSSIPKEEQDNVFRPAEIGCRKIILATNIAETSITVPEVVYVVDAGKLREARYDQTRRIRKLQCVWESKSNLKQRAGRAGRIQDGFYYGLFSKERADSLSVVGLPELLRTDLQEICLSVQSQDFGEPIVSFLSQAIEPPSQSAINTATRNLIDIGGLTLDEQLTDLGRILARLPVQPALGKMILLGVIFKCLDPMIILGAAADERRLFLAPLGKREEARAALFAYTSHSGSDHIGVLEAFNQLRAIKARSGYAAAARHGQEHFLHMGSYRNIEQSAEQISKILEDSGLIRKQEQESTRFGPPELNTNAANHELIKALLLAGVHQHLAAKLHAKGSAYRTRSERGVIIHPSSTNATTRGSEKQRPFGSLLIYSELSQSNDGKVLFMRETSPVTPLMAALFGGELRMVDDKRLVVEDWLNLEAQGQYSVPPAKVVLEFRKALDRVLQGAFASLADIDVAHQSGWVNDPVREHFTRRLVEVLQNGSTHL